MKSPQRRRCESGNVRAVAYSIPVQHRMHLRFAALFCLPALGAVIATAVVLENNARKVRQEAAAQQLSVLAQAAAGAVDSNAVLPPPQSPPVDAALATTRKLARLAGNRSDILSLRIIQPVTGELPRVWSYFDPSGTSDMNSFSAPIPNFADENAPPAVVDTSSRRAWWAAAPVRSRQEAVLAVAWVEMKPLPPGPWVSALRTLGPVLAGTLGLVLLLGLWLGRSLNQVARQGAGLAERLRRGDTSARWRPPREDEFRLLAVSMDALGLQLHTQAEATSRMRSYLPAKLAQQVDSSPEGTVEPARRHAAFICCELRSLARYGEGRAPEEAGAMAQAFLSRVLPLVSTSACHWELHPGGTLFAVWGLFTESRMATVEALRVARSILTLAREVGQQHGFDLGLSMGLHEGPVVVTTVQADGQRRLLLAGDPVAVALRVPALCRDLGITAVATEEAVARIPIEISRGATRFVGEAEVRGRLRPLRLHAIERDQPSRNIAPATPLAEPKGI